jgi:hypothetical protein
MAARGDEALFNRRTDEIVADFEIARLERMWLLSDNDEEENTNDE